jgi:peptide/nickel transport system permease protein
VAREAGSGRGALTVFASLVWRRTAGAIALLAGVVVASFLLFNIAPGDPARVILGPNASVEAVERLRKALGTDRPLLDQFGRHLADLGRLDLGRSVIDGRRVTTEVGAKFATTARLALVAAVLSLLVSYGLTFIAFHFQARWLLLITRIGAVTPTYCAGVLAALFFGVVLPVVPLTGYGTAEGGWSVLLLPSLIAALYPIAAMTGVLDEKIRSTARLPFARAAQAYGASRAALFHRTLLPAVLVSWLALWVNQVSVIFVASFVLEVIFTIPGTGVLLIEALQRKDYPMLQGILLVNASFFIALSGASDIAFRWFDPRLRDHA